MLAESNRQGPWSVHKITYANVLLGSVTLDLTEATFPARTIEVSCTQLLGQITIRVPLGTTVRMETANVLGDTSVKHIGEPDPPARRWSSAAPTSWERSLSAAPSEHPSGAAA